MQPTVHVPVMLNEVMELGDVQPGQTWIDGTGGGGGHARRLADRIGARGRLLVVDRDPQAILRLRQNLPETICLRQASYDELPRLLAELEWGPVDGILLDLGLSSDQLSDRDRGFSFLSEGPLDMRFDPTCGIAAWQWLARVDERTLADTIFKYGEERFSRRIARRIVQSRREQPIRTAQQLRELIYRCVPAGRATRAGGRHGRIDPATRTFQALRIAVNEELQILERALALLPDCLAIGGRFLVISFHSLEDRLVKQAFRQDDRLEIVTRKPVQANDTEVAENPRARSAKLRVARRIAVGVQPLG